LYNLNPPGAFYQDWHSPTGTDDEAMARAEGLFGPDSYEAATMRLMLEYRNIYGPCVPLAAAGQLDLVLADTGLVTKFAQFMAGTRDGIRDSLHSLHAQGLLLIADDGSLWMTVPPGTPCSAPNGQWTFVEKKADAPPEPAVAR
jgi:hypothetical protein